jgi:hypothetical protein
VFFYENPHFLMQLDVVGTRCQHSVEQGQNQVQELKVFLKRTGLVDAEAIAGQAAGPNKGKG